MASRTWEILRNQDRKREKPIGGGGNETNKLIGAGEIKPLPGSLTASDNSKLTKNQKRRAKEKAKKNGKDEVTNR